MKKICMLLAATLMATSALAQDLDGDDIDDTTGLYIGTDPREHTVVIESRGYFPSTVHVNPGDTIKFINKSPNWVYLFSSDYDDDLSDYDATNACENPSTFSGSKDGWRLTWFAKNESKVLEVTSCTETTLLAPYVWRQGWYSNTYRGYISFDDPATSY